MWVVLTKKWPRYGRGPEIIKREFEKKEDAERCYTDLMYIGELPEIYKSEKLN